MLNSQKIEIERIKVAQQINAPRLVEMRATDEDFESRMGERKTLQQQLDGLNDQKIKALQEEAGEVAGVSFDGANDGESSEMRSLIRSASVARILNHVAEGRSVNNGPEREVQEHFGLSSNWIPLRMLLEPEDGHRAAASFGASPAQPGTSSGLAPQVFGESIAQLPT